MQFYVSGLRWEIFTRSASHVKPWSLVRIKDNALLSFFLAIDLINVHQRSGRVSAA